MGGTLQKRSGPGHYREVSSNGNGIGIVQLTDCSFDEHEHRHAEISMLFGGRTPTLITHNDSGTRRRINLHNDSVVFTPPDQPHKINWHGTGKLVNLYVNAEYLIEFAESVGYRRRDFASLSKPHHALHGIGTLLLDEYRSCGALSSASIDHTTALVLRPILRMLNGPEQSLPRSLLPMSRLRTAVDYLHAYPERDISLLGLSRLCNSSPYHFARSFSARLGTAPFAYQRALRLEKAKQLLAGSSLRIEVVASAVGFKTPEHFSRTFRRYVGSTPREFRRTATMGR